VHITVRHVPPRNLDGRTVPRVCGRILATRNLQAFDYILAAGAFALGRFHNHQPRCLQLSIIGHRRRKQRAQPSRLSEPRCAQINSVRFAKLLGFPSISALPIEVMPAPYVY
jgi:hypothetical protein